MAYANPADIADEKRRGDGYGIVRFQKRSDEVTFECWPRFSHATEGRSAQFSGWPITIKRCDNDGRRVTGWLPEFVFASEIRPVIQVIDESTDEVLYTVRARDNRFQPRVYSSGTFAVKIGIDAPTALTFAGLEPRSQAAAEVRVVSI
ncbi:MAG: hypothetical protein FJ198_05270 [Gammaproteobacteria bacterium]|nr:hypothetical protein [Gammaproteobacteria bacterium]